MVHVGIIMGSQSDWPTMKHAADILDALKIPYESKIVSAHRTPDRLWAYSTTAIERGLKVIIAGAGGAAHLPGMVASKTRIPVVGVPVHNQSAFRYRQPIFHSTNAQRLSCGHHGNWCSRRSKCWLVSRRHARHARS